MKQKWYAISALLFLLLIFLAPDPVSAQQIFTTARTEGFGSPSLLLGISFTRIDEEEGEDFNAITARASIGIGRKTDVFGSFEGILGEGLVDTNFAAFTVGIKHQFIRTGIVDIGSLVRFRGNRTEEDRYEDALLDFVGIVSIHATPFYPYFALIYTRPFGLDFNDDFQRSSIVGVEIPLGDIPRILGEVSLGDRRSFGLAFKLSL